MKPHEKGCTANDVRQQTGTTHKNDTSRNFLDTKVSLYQHKQGKSKLTDLSKVDYNSLYFAYSTGDITETHENKNTRISFDGLCKKLSLPPDKIYLELQKTFVDGFNKGLSKKEVNALKLSNGNTVKRQKDSSHYFLHGGYCPQGRVMAEFEYNGSFQIDVDFKEVGGDKLAKETKEKFKTDKNVLFVGRSHSGVGVKALIKTDLKNIDHYRVGIDIIKKHLSDKHGIDINKIDSLSATGACFEFKDKNLYVNHDAYVLPIEKEVEREVKRIIKEKKERDEKRKQALKGVVIDNKNEKVLRLALNSEIKKGNDCTGTHESIKGYYIKAFKDGIEVTEAFNFLAANISIQHDIKKAESFYRWCNSNLVFGEDRDRFLFEIAESEREFKERKSGKNDNFCNFTDKGDLKQGITINPPPRVIDKRLSEDIEYIKEKLKTAVTFFFLIAPTRSGKTSIFYFLAKWYTKLTGGKMYFAYPSNFANEGQVRLYSNKENNKLELELDIASFDQFTPVEMINQFAPEAIDNSDCVNLVYNSWDKVAEFITEKDLIICDEPHKWITQAGITPSKEINKILNCKAKKVFITATPNDSFLKEFAPDVTKYERKVNPKVKINCITLKNGKKTSFNIEQSNKLCRLALRNYISSLNPKEEKIYPVFLNHKEELEQSSKIAKELGFDTGIVNADKKDTPEYKALTAGKPLEMNGKAKVLFLTSLGFDSIGITNPSEQIGSIGIFGEIHRSNVIQAVGRPENAKEIEVFYFLPSDGNKKGFFTSYETHRVNYWKDYQKQLGLLKEYTPAKVMNLSVEEFKNIKSDINLVLEDGSFDRMKCVSDYENDQAKYESNLQKFAALAEVFDTEEKTIDVSEIHTLFENGKDNSKKNLEQLTKDIERTKEKKEKDIEMIRGIMFNNLKYCMMCLIHKRIDTRVKSAIRNYLGKQDYSNKEYLEFKEKLKLDSYQIKLISRYALRFIKLYQYFGTGKENIAICFDKSYQTVLNAVKKAEILEGKDRSKQAYINKIFYDDIINSFKQAHKLKPISNIDYNGIEKLVPRKYTKQEILDLTDSAFGKWKHKYFTERERLSLVNQLFFTKSKPEKVGKKTVRLTPIWSTVNIDRIKEGYTSTVQYILNKDMLPESVTVSSDTLQKDYYKTDTHTPF